MNVRIVVQTNAAGDVNVHLLTDPLSPIEDSVVVGGGWSQPTLTRGLLIIEDKEADDLIVDREFRATSNVAPDEQYTHLTAADDIYWRAVVEDRR